MKCLKFVYFVILWGFVASAATAAEMATAGAAGAAGATLAGARPAANSSALSANPEASGEAAPTVNLPAASVSANSSGRLAFLDASGGVSAAETEAPNPSKLVFAQLSRGDFGQRTSANSSALSANPEASGEAEKLPDSSKLVFAQLSRGDFGHRERASGEDRTSSSSSRELASDEQNHPREQVKTEITIDEAQLLAAAEQAAAAPNPLEMEPAPAEFAELFDLANQIRGSSYECFGADFFAPLSEFSAQVWTDYERKKLDAIEDYEQKHAYFFYWALQSLYNYRQFEAFERLAASSCERAAGHFASLAGTASGGEALCARFVQRFGQRAFGALKPPYRHLDAKYAGFLELRAADAISFLSLNSLSEAELDFLLKISLLRHMDLTIIDFLLTIGAPLDSGYESAIFYAIAYPEALRLLLARGAAADYANNFGKTALMYAADFNQHESARTLLRYGAQINAAQAIKSATLPFYMSNCGVKHQGKTALMAAAANADVAMLKLLLEAGANADATDAQGLKALDYAQIYERAENEKFLKQIMNKK